MPTLSPSRYERRGFVGLVYLHDFSQDIASTDIQHDLELLCAIIGPGFYDHTVLVLNKYEDGLTAEFPRRRPEIQGYWQNFMADHEAVIQENGTDRGTPRPIVELIWEKPPATFALAEDLIHGKKLRMTGVGKVYGKLLKKEIKEIKGTKGGISTTTRARLNALKIELRKWKKCSDKLSDLLQS